MENISNDIESIPMQTSEKINSNDSVKSSLDQNL